MTTLVNKVKPYQAQQLGGASSTYNTDPAWTAAVNVRIIMNAVVEHVVLVIAYLSGSYQRFFWSF